MTTPGMHRPFTAAGQAAVAAARDRQQRCLCGEHEEDGECVTPAQAARMRAYLAAHPGREFAYDDAGGNVTVALVIPRDPGPPEVLATAALLGDLLDAIGAPPAESLS